MKISETEKKHLIQACFTATQHELSFIDAYSNVRDGSEINVIKKSNMWINRWKKLERKLEESAKQGTRKINRQSVPLCTFCTNEADHVLCDNCLCDKIIEANERE